MIKTPVRTFTSIFTQQQRTILSAAFVIIITVLLSKILGFVRLRLLFASFRPEAVGVYLAAFRLPDMLFELLIMGTLSTAFIPVFTGLLEKNNQREAFLMASSVINISFIVICLMTVPLLIFTRQISFVLVPGLSASSRPLMISYTRIMLVGQLLPLIIGNFVTGMLQSLQRFIIPALAPVVYNVGIILGILFLVPLYGMYGVVWGVVLGGVLYLLVQLPLLFLLGYKHTFSLNLAHPGVRKVGKLMVPRMLGLAVTQIDTTVDLILASLLGDRFIAIFYSAQYLQQFPIGLFGITFAQAALPALSLAVAENNLDAYKRMFLATMHQILFFVLPTAVMLIVLRIPLVRLAYGTDKFDWAATVNTGQTLALFAISIFAQGLVQLFARAFYALHDTKTPVVISVISVGVNTVLSLVFILVWHLPVWSLALSTSIASLMNWLLLLLFLYRKVSGFDTRELLVPPIKMILASAATGIFLYVPMKLLDQLVFDTTHVFDLILLTGVATVSGLSVYIFLAWFLDIEEVATFFKLLHKIKRMPRVFFSPLSELIDGERPPLS